MSSKHLFNDPDGLVVKSLRGAVMLNPALRLHASSKTVYVSRESASTSRAQVLVISGGGAGHEPAHAGYTGVGMLHACVSGNIFASPSATQITTAIDLALGDENKEKQRAILFVVNNYTGDCLNFGLAAEKARSRGIQVASVTVADDVAVGRAQGGLVGRRGLAGNILVCKILGAAAERGLNLACLVSLGEAVVGNLASIGLSLDHCHVPGKGRSASDWERLGNDVCEVGLGLHNEKGVRRLEATPSPSQAIALLLELLLDQNDSDRAFVKFSEDKEEETVLYVNNLGGMSQLEMGAIVEETMSQLEKKNIFPRRVYCSAYMTSLNAPGFSLSLLNVSAAKACWKVEPSDVSTPPTILELLDDPSEAQAWAGARAHWPTSPRDFTAEEKGTEQRVRSQDSRTSRTSGLSSAGQQLNSAHSIIQSAAQSVLEAEPKLTEFDTVCGDGDCGATFAAGANAVLTSLNEDMLDVSNPSWLALGLAEIVERSMGGTSGALFSLFFTALSTSLQSAPWRHACDEALTALSKYTPAKPGDRTLIDALSPYCKALKEGATAHEAARAARRGAESTAGMRPRLGRAVYVGEGEAADSRLPDPGAWGVMVIAEGIAAAFLE